MHVKFGTMTWLERSGGRLAWHERLWLLAQGVQARWAARQNVQRRGGAQLPLREVSDILPPDSGVIREAIAIAQDCSPPFLFNHCMRAYFWARLLDRDTRPFDDEALFVAILLHDLGLTDRWRLRGQSDSCFTVVGARAALDLAERWQWDDARAQRSANAIALHLNVQVGDGHGKEAQMLRAGSGADVAGLGLAQLPDAQIQQVVERFPRLQLKSALMVPLMTEVRERPCCRMAFLCKTLGFTALIERNRVFVE